MQTAGRSGNDGPAGAKPLTRDTGYWLMFVIGNFLSGLAQVLDLALNIYFWIVIARAVLSWVNPDPYNPIVRFLNRATEPVLHWVRRRLPTSFGGIDFGPMIVILAIIFLRTFLVGTLADLARSIH